MSPSRPCAHPTCPNYAIPTGKGRCQRHARARDKQINRAGRSVYSTAKWKNTRKKKLAAVDYICEYVDPDEGPCMEVANQVHHRVALADGGAPWDMANLEALCPSHHARHTRAEQLAKAN